MHHQIENLNLKTTSSFRVRRRLQKFAQPFFSRCFFHATLNGLSERGTTLSLDTSKGEVFHVVHVWQ